MYGGCAHARHRRPHDPVAPGIAAGARRGRLLPRRDRGRDGGAPSAAPRDKGGVAGPARLRRLDPPACGGWTARPAGQRRLHRPGPAPFRCLSKLVGRESAFAKKS